MVPFRIGIFPTRHTYLVYSTPEQVYENGEARFKGYLLFVLEQKVFFLVAQTTLFDQLYSLIGKQCVDLL